MTVLDLRQKGGEWTRQLRTIGLVIGAAMKIGLHCDGAVLGFSLFEVGMRRRLWWHICTLDVRTAQDHGSEPSILESAFNTELPSNINDASVHPDMSESRKASRERLR